MKKCVIALILCVYSLVICSVVYYAVWHNPVKDYEIISLIEQVEHKTDYNNIRTTNDIVFLVNNLGRVSEKVSGEKIEICASYLGYVYFPAGRAYGRLRQLNIQYDVLYRYYEKSLQGNNRLRSILLAGLLCEQDPKRFSNDAQNLLRSTKNTNEKVLIFQGMIEAFMPTMVLSDIPVKRADTFYDTFYAEGKKFYHDELSLLETNNFILQEMTKVVVPLSKQIYHGRMVIYDARELQLLLQENYDEYVSYMREK